MLDLYTMANMDYQYLHEDFKQGKFGNLFCVGAQSVCERFIKHVIDLAQPQVNTIDIMQVHSLKILARFCQEHIPEFICDWNTVLLADGYYRNACYPVPDAIITNQTDTINCNLAMETIHSAVEGFIKVHIQRLLNGRQSDTLEGANTTEKLNTFSSTEIEYKQPSLLE